MNGKHWLSRVGGGMGAIVFAALIAGSLGGCKLLKPKDKKPLGGDCANDLDCTSLVCSTDGNICSQTCTYDKDCTGAPNLVCRRKDDNSGNWCATATGTPPGGSCMNTYDCQHNECLKYVAHPEQPGICTKYCASTDDCPAGQKICDKISDTGMLKVCLPGDPATPAAQRQQFAPTPRTPRPAGARPAAPASRPAAPAPHPAAPPPAPAKPAKRPGH